MIDQLLTISPNDEELFNSFTKISESFKHLSSCFSRLSSLISTDNQDDPENAETPHKINFRKKKKKRSNAVSKVYEVKAVVGGKYKTGYRLFVKCADISQCFGPYLDQAFVTSIKKQVLEGLNDFDISKPGTKERIDKFLKELKATIDETYKPLEMYRTRKEGRIVTLKKIHRNN